jgi:hypothetical protein
MKSCAFGLRWALAACAQAATLANAEKLGGPQPPG